MSLDPVVSWHEPLGGTIVSFRFSLKMVIFVLLNMLVLDGGVKCSEFLPKSIFDA